jgi:hypothetical protein
VKGRFWIWSGFAALLTLTLCYVFGGNTGLAGAALGICGTSLNNAGLWAVITLLGAAGSESAPSRLGATVLVLLFLIKLPVFLLLAMLSLRIGGAAVPCFLAGLAVVYFSTFWWALARR